MKTICSLKAYTLDTRCVLTWIETDPKIFNVDIQIHAEHSKSFQEKFVSLRGGGGGTVTLFAPRPTIFWIPYLHLLSSVAYGLSITVRKVLEEEKRCGPLGIWDYASESELLWNSKEADQPPAGNLHPPFPFQCCAVHWQIQLFWNYYLGWMPLLALWTQQFQLKHVVLELQYVMQLLKNASHMHLNVYQISRWKYCFY